MKKFSLAVLFLFLFAFSAFADQIYPLIDIQGYKKWEYKDPKVDPQRNLFSGLSYLGGYYPTFSGGPWQERLQLHITGQLSENLSVGYDVEQQPETPERFDVKVKYYNNELTFGDFTANFSGNEFVSTSRYLNGIMLTAKDSWYDVIAVPSAKLKSQTQALTSQKGNNTRGPYNLGHGSIVEGTEQIRLNDIPLIRNRDYTIDYFEGKITFNRILSQTDEFKYSYEYTNMLDLFFPTLSKRDFTGLQTRFTIDPERIGKSAPKEEAVINLARETYPSVGTIEPEVQEEEASGRYRSKLFPVVKFSESLTFMGSRLKKDEDYLIRYDSGEIKLLTRFLPTPQDPLTVEYKYYQTSTEVEAIPGIGSRGPYRTKNHNLIAESERVEVDGKLFVRDLDYTIRYDLGELLFGVVIGPTSQIKIRYTYNVMAIPQVVVSKFPKEIKVGATYLRESAKKSTGTATATVIESYSGQTIISNNFLLNLVNRPLITSEVPVTVRLKQGGVTTTLTAEVDFTIPTTEVDPATGFIRVTPDVKLPYTTDRSDPTDGYGTGSIFFYNSRLNLSATDEISVTYAYEKSIVGKYSGVGDNTKGPYYLRNIRDVVPGTETVQVWDQGSSQITTYTRNSSFDASAGDTGYSINYNSFTPSITFNKELATTKNFQAIFQYVPPSVSGSDTIAQSAYGLDGIFQIGDVFKVDTSFARSETDQLVVGIATVESFFGSGRKDYTLQSPKKIIDGTEKISVNNNILNRDIDYFFSYDAPGKFTFYYITPSSLDAISVDYTYQEQTGTSGVGNTKVDTAYRLGAETKVFGDVLTLSGKTKKIGFDFSPLGATAIGVGSSYDEYNLAFKPDFHSFYFNYAYKFNNNPIGTSRQTFSRSFDRSYTGGLNPNGLAKIDFSYRDYLTDDDPLQAGGTRSSDNQQTAYSGSVVPVEWKRGLLTINQRYDARKTVSENDIVDKTNLTKTTIDYYHAGADLKFTDRLSAGFDWQHNESMTINSVEARTAHNQAIDRSYNLSLDLTMGFLQKWTARVSLINHDDINKIATPEATSSTRNETYHMDLTPISILSSSLDHNRQERSSYVVGGENPRSERTAASARLSPISWFSIGGNASKSEIIPETGVNYRTYGRSLGGDMDWTPISFQVVTLKTRLVHSDAYQLAPLGAESSVRTDTIATSGSLTMSLNPIPILPLTLGYVQEDYRNRNYSTVSPVTTETQNLTYQVGLTFTPRLPFTLSGNFNQKQTNDKISRSTLTKTIMDAKASYQITTWGTLAFDWQSEDNGGEVQAGVLTSLNYLKETLNRTLSITIPLNTQVVTNFIVLASWKSVNYKDRSNTSNDFYAQMISVEGTLNF